jgi:small subunit ribosomal protein S4e
MSSKGGRRHLKKLAAPKSWNIERKDRVWVAKPRPGPHPVKSAMPVTTILTIVLKKANTSREAERLIKGGEVFVDERAVRDPKFPVGFMDVLSFPSIDEYYLVSYDKYGRLRLQKLAKAQKFKLCRIERKTTVKKNKKQIGLHDGRTMLVDKEYNTWDILKISLPDQKILDHLEFKKGNLAYAMKGKHAGKMGKIKEELSGTATREALVVMEKNGETFNVPKKYLFVVGRDKPEIAIE